MTNDEIRNANLLLLIEKVGGMRQLADRVGHGSTSTLSQIKNRSPDSKTGKPKGIGVVLARKLEKATGQETGWMDIPHETANSFLTVDTSKISSLQPSPPQWPFADISPARWYAVDERVRTKIEEAIEERVREWEVTVNHERTMAESSRHGRPSGLPPKNRANPAESNKAGGQGTRRTEGAEDEPDRSPVRGE